MPAGRYSRPMDMPLMNTKAPITMAAPIRQRGPAPATGQSCCPAPASLPHAPRSPHRAAGTGAWAHSPCPLGALLGAVGRHRGQTLPASNSGDTTSARYSHNGSGSSSEFIPAPGFQACDAHLCGQTGPGPDFVWGLPLADLTIARCVRGWIDGSNVHSCLLHTKF
jgi:hypothetical protein